MHISHRVLHYTARLQVPAVFELGKQSLEVMPRPIGSALKGICVIIKERKLFRQFLHESLNLPDTNLPVSSNSYQEIIRFDKNAGQNKQLKNRFYP